MLFSLEILSTFFSRSSERWVASLSLFCIISNLACVCVSVSVCGCCCRRRVYELGDTPKITMAAKTKTTHAGTRVTKWAHQARGKTNRSRSGRPESQGHFLDGGGLSSAMIMYTIGRLAGRRMVLPRAAALVDSYCCCYRASFRMPSFLNTLPENTLIHAV